MKAWGRSLSIVILAVALLAAPAVASGATGKAAGIKFGSFELSASNGYTVEVSVFKEDGSPGVTVVSAENGPLRATYEVRTDAPPGIHATFGVLGRLDLSFKRQAKAVERLEDGCRWISERGVFRGTLRFVGEGGYFSVEVHDPGGEMLRLPDGFCGFNDRRARPFLGLESRTLEARRKVEGKELSFQASKEEFVRRLTSFSASLRERVDGMSIVRSATTRGPDGGFSSVGASRGSVHPPAPFVGSASFRDPVRAPATWTGSLSVTFPGAPETALAGDGFAAKLCRRLPILRQCLNKPPTPRAPRVSAPYGSGSHSQPLALARLSSLR
jgi:hypothetical protein